MEVKRLPINGEKYLEIILSDKELVSRTYKEYLKLNIKKKKTAKDFEYIFSKEDDQSAHEMTPSVSH